MSGGDRSQNFENRIVGPVENVSRSPRQPRQPRTFQDLLRYSVEAESPSHPTAQPSFPSLDQERRRFLEQALSSMVQDVIKELTDAMTTLKPLTSPIPQRDENELPSYEAALTTISELVDNIDIANDFLKLGGFDLMSHCLVSVFDTVRWQSADIIALCTQNNPVCQKGAIDHALLPKLVLMVDKDKDTKCMVKAFYALSCIIRDSEEGLKQFMDLDGFSLLIRVLQSNNEPLKVKSSFLVSSLASQNPEVKETLINMGYIEQLIGLIQTEHSRAHEHLMCSLLSLINENPSAIEECRRPELHLQSCLEKLIEDYQHDEAYLEEVDYVRQIIKLAFSGEIEGER